MIALVVITILSYSQYCSDHSPLNNIFVSYLSMVNGFGQGNSFRIKNEDLNQNGDFVFSHQISDTVPSGNFKINYLSADDSLKYKSIFPVNNLQLLIRSSRPVISKNHPARLMRMPQLYHLVLFKLYMIALVVITILSYEEIVQMTRH